MPSYKVWTRIPEIYKHNLFIFNVVFSTKCSMKLQSAGYNEELLYHPIQHPMYVVFLNLSDEDVTHLALLDITLMLETRTEMIAALHEELKKHGY